MEESIKHIEKLEKLIWPVLSGVIFLLYGYQILTVKAEKQVAWHEKYGTFFKIIGFLCIAYGIASLFF